MRFRRPVTLCLILLFLVQIFGIYSFTAPLAFATTETRYFWNAAWTKNGLSANSWNTTQDASSGTSESVTGSNVSAVGYLAFDVILRDSDGLDYYTLGSKVGQVTRSTDGAGYQTNNSWTCPAYSCNATDTILVKLYMRWQTAGSWTFKRNWTSEVIGAGSVDSAAWNFNIYTYMITDWDFFTRNFYIYYGSSTWSSRIENVQWTPPPYPQYYTVTEDPVDAAFPSQTVNFTCNWTRGTTETLSYYVFENNNTGTATNTTYAMPASTTTYLANHTLTANSSGNCVITYKWYCNNSADNWNSTDTFNYYVFSVALPDISNKDFGRSNGYSLGGTFFAGAKWNIYVAYQNTSTSPWSMCVRAWDMNGSFWTEPYIVEDDPETHIGIGESSWNDNHWMPMISILPTGNLIVGYGYYSDFFYKVSTNNASTETNTTKLVSEWESYQWINESSSKFGYPEMLRWDDRLILFGRSGTSTASDWIFSIHNGTAFNTTFTTLLDAPSGMYADFYKSGDNILGSFNKINSTYEGDIGFCYSPDKGDSWKFVNGTALTLPINVTQCIIQTSGLRSRHLGAILDDTSIPQVMYYYEDGWYPENILGRNVTILRYSTTLGSSGTWTSISPVDADTGANILVGHNGAFCTYYLDSYYDMPALWTSNASSGKVTKYVQLPTNRTLFKGIYEDTTGYKHQLSVQLIRDAPDCYEVFSMETQLDVLGNDTVGSTYVHAPDGYLYGTKFTAQYNSTIDGAWIYCNTTNNDNYWQVALYNSSYYLITSTSKAGLVSGTIGDGWLLSLTFSSPPSVVEGEDYWITFRSLDDISFRGDPSSITSQSFRASCGYYDSLPNNFTTLTPTWYDRTCSILVGPRYMRVRGLGVDEFATHFSNIASNSTWQGEPCLFTATAEDYSGLDYANFRTNNTGSWVNTTYMYLGTPPETLEIIEFTATLNTTAYVVVAWEIWVNDTGDNWAGCTTQHITITAYVQIALELAVPVALTLQRQCEVNVVSTWTPSASFSFARLATFNTVSEFTVSPSFSFARTTTMHVVSSWTSNVVWNILFGGHEYTFVSVIDIIVAFEYKRTVEMVQILQTTVTTTFDFVRSCNFALALDTPFSFGFSFTPDLGGLVPTPPTPPGGEPAPWPYVPITPGVPLATPRNILFGIIVCAVALLGIRYLVKSEEHPRKARKHWIRHPQHWIRQAREHRLRKPKKKKVRTPK